MDKWEYRTEIIHANIENKGIREDLAKKYPNWTPSKYSPETMEPHLDYMGDNGWELVTMQSIAGSGNNLDVFYNGEISSYSNVYFCVYKRRKND